MLTGALGWLLLDLSNIDEADRSAYESALHYELLEIARSLQSIVDVAGEQGGNFSKEVSSAFTENSRGLDRIESGLPFRVRNASREWIAELRIDAISQPGASDVRRMSCDYNRCPNKKL